MMRRPMSVAGALRRDIFEEDQEFNVSIISDIDSPEEGEEDKCEEKKPFLVPNEHGKMDDESSFAESSKESGQSKFENHKGDKSSSYESRSSSSSEDQPPDRHNKKIKVIRPSKFSSKTSKFNNLRLENKGNLRKKLDISRETIVEVDEEHQSETNKFVGSSEHKSSSRRFHKVLNTLRGNSPNSSVNALAHKDFSDSSNPYYENIDSPLICAPSDDLKLLKIKAQKNRKKKSSKNITKKLSEKRTHLIKSDRSRRTNADLDVVHMNISQGDDVNKISEREVKADELLEDNPITPSKGKKSEPENISSTSDLQSSEHLDYLEDIDSPISTDSNIDNFFDFEEGFEKTKSKLPDEVSIGETDTGYQKAYGKIYEEEKKLYANNSQSTIKSENKKSNKSKETPKMEIRNFRAHNSVRNHALTRNLDRSTEEFKQAYNQRAKLPVNSPDKNASTSAGLVTHLSHLEGKARHHKKHRYNDRYKNHPHRKMLTNKEIIHLKYSSSFKHSYEEDKDFIKNRIKEREMAKKETPWKAIADNIKARKKLKTLNKESKQKLASNKIKFKYSSLRDVVSEEKKEIPKTKFQ